MKLKDLGQLWIALLQWHFDAASTCLSSMQHTPMLLETSGDRRTAVWLYCWFPFICASPLKSWTNISSFHGAGKRWYLIKKLFNAIFQSSPLPTIKFSSLEGAIFIIYYKISKKSSSIFFKDLLLKKAKWRFPRLCTWCT